ncbi:sigma-70 family RNA polymerase sigma factor [Tessaracoccus sp. MC1627]|uniref:sigma-70 family RNA polymerase sigma factor n=1 Tax=Tessaracoccus sp. MC1627 TaxID=2760312 RepID=UPI0016048D8D|nr:sigma-70 family RNA polymerase sigma factor [Tessaracoccus sp. MC1627]MBB1512857.1 sigma-70 family RNA polymerase sigma factor [Tessaracoccus sp. MC1627]
MFPLVDRAPDAALIAGLAVNDDAAAAAFVRRFEGPVFGMALSVIRDRGLAEEIAQEAFLRAWKAAATYDARRGSVLTWLLAITRNLAIDAIRARRSFPIDHEVLDHLVSTTLRDGRVDDIGVRLEAAEAAGQLRQLPPEQARAVVLSVIAGNTAQQVADHEGIPLGTAKTRIRTGLRRMRQALEVDDG